MQYIREKYVTSRIDIDRILKRIIKAIIHYYWGINPIIEGFENQIYRFFEL